jgi:beta-lactam-binding protein with PASTA domain
VQYTNWRDLELPPAEISVPNLTGLAPDAAEARLFAAGLQVGSVTDEFRCDEFIGRVTRQNARPVELVPPNTPIDFSVGVALPGC